jgi:UDP-N-acetylglucosamine:LPS N-acetylglucosamine transferase
MNPSTRRKRVLAISSGGGHWVQLRSLAGAFADHDVSYATVHSDYRSDVPRVCPFYTIRDATRWDRFGLIILVLQVVRIVFVTRPQVVISTGAAPGYIAIRIGKMFGARTVWVDSIANVECMSMAGMRVKKYADLWLTQWAHLAKPEGPNYRGAVF